MRSIGWAAAMAVVTSCGAAAPAYAQAVGQVLIDSKSPFFPVTVTNDDAHAVKMPDLAYTPTAEDEGNYDKYFYFHRADTDYATAYADIVECDGYARGLSGQVSPIYGQGILGDAIGSAISDAIYGSANRRKVRRANMRACMGYKGYDRFGLSKPIWEAFNFEEGNKTIPEDIRTGFLKQQALVASSAQPQGKALGQ